MGGVTRRLRDVCIEGGHLGSIDIDGDLRTGPAHCILNIIKYINIKILK